MPGDGAQLPQPDTHQAPGTVRHDRPSLVAFVTDSRSEEAVREGLSDCIPEPPDIRRGGVRAAIAAMQKQATPRVLLVDVSGEEQPLSALGELSGVVEPDVCVLVVGEVAQVGFYREITRGLGVTEYLSKPLAREEVARYFGACVTGHVPTPESILGGRAIAVTGVHGGVGATSIAVNLAWNLGVRMRRHTVLLDPDLHLGAAAFMLSVQPGQGLGMALEAPQRIDALLAERTAQPVADRLHVLAGEEKMGLAAQHAEGAAASLLSSLRNRYNLIVADVPFAPVPLYRDLLELVDQRVLVLDPTLLSVRSAVRLLALPRGTTQEQRPVLVLNRNGMPGGLPRKQIEDALKMKMDVVIPDLPRQMGNAVTLGEPAISNCTPFRAAIEVLTGKVAFARLLDGGPDVPEDRAGQRRPGWRWLLGRA